MIETRVEDLIQDYMNHYQVSFEEAKKIMVEDLSDATDCNETFNKGEEN